MIGWGLVKKKSLEKDDRSRQKFISFPRAYESYIMKSSTPEELSFVLTRSFTRSGVLPYYFIEDKKYYFFGVDTIHDELTDFGGTIEKSDTNYIECAFRELQEESISIFKVDPKRYEILLTNSAFLFKYQNAYTKFSNCTIMCCLGKLKDTKELDHRSYLFKQTHDRIRKEYLMSGNPDSLEKHHLENYDIVWIHEDDLKKMIDEVKVILPGTLSHSIHQITPDEIQEDEEFKKFLLRGRPTYMYKERSYDFASGMRRFYPRLYSETKNILNHNRDLI